MSHIHDMYQKQTSGDVDSSLHPLDWSSMVDTDLYYYDNQVPGNRTNYIQDAISIRNTTSKFRRRLSNFRRRYRRLEAPFLAVWFIYLMLTSAPVLDSDPLLSVWVNKITPTLGSFWSKDVTLRRMQHYLSDGAEAVRTFEFMNNQRLGKLPASSIAVLDRPIARPVRRYCHQELQAPRMDEISMINGQWQAIDPASGIEEYLFSATLDQRQSIIEAKEDATSPGVVQVLAMIDQSRLSPVVSINLFCQIWTTSALSESPSLHSVVRGEIREIWIRSWDPRNPFTAPVLISCPLPSAMLPNMQMGVSVTTTACGRATNRLPVGIEKRIPRAERNHTVVCVKGMDFLDDISLRLVEWFEANLMFGANKIVMYTYTVHANVSKVFNHYVRSGHLEIVPLSLPGGQPDIPEYRSAYIHRNRQQKRRNELLPYNDCFYRHLHSHNFTLIIDTDELVVPSAHRREFDAHLGQTHWAKILSSVVPGGDFSRYTAFSIPNAFFFDNLTLPGDIVGTSKRSMLDKARSKQDASPTPTYPAYLHMLRHPKRSQKVSEAGSYGKSFINVDNALTVFNHFVLHKRAPGIKSTTFISPNIAIKQHYKGTCPIESRDECPMLYKRTVVDTSLQRYGRKLKKRVESSLRLLGLLN